MGTRIRKMLSNSDRNKKRRALYKVSAEFRDSCRTWNRACRRKSSSGARIHNECWSNDAIKALDLKLAVVTCLFPEGKLLPRTIFTAEDCGRVWGDWKATTIHRWIRIGVIPPPVVEIAGSNTHQRGYTLPEVLAIADVVRDHRTKKRYLQLIDKATIRAIYLRVSLVRQKAKHFGEAAKITATHVKESSYEKRIQPN